MKKRKLPPLAKIDVTCDVVIFTIADQSLQVLLVKRSIRPALGKWSLPGGFLWAGESSARAADRIVAEKAGVSGVHKEQLFTFDDPQRDPRGHVISISYLTLTAFEKIKIDSTLASHQVELMRIDSLGELAFDHRQIITVALERLRSKLLYTSIIYSILPTSFTLTQLQRAYEIILGKSLDKRNFRRKFLALKLIEPTGQMQSGVRQRPAQLYRFKSTKLEVLTDFFD